MSHSNEKLQSSQNNKNFFGRANEKLTKITAGTLIALGAVGLSACAPSEAQPPTPPVATETAEPTPTETEAPVERFGDFDREDPLPEDLEYLDNMTAAEFAQQPKLEQLRWASWAGQYKDEFIDAWLIISPETEQYDGHYVLAADSDPLTALQDMSYNNRIAANFGTGTPKDNRFNGKLDRQLSEKYITAYTLTETGQWRIDQFINERLSTNDGQAINVATQAMSDMYNFRQDAETAGDFIATNITHEIEGVQYSGWRVQYTYVEEGKGVQDVSYVIVPYIDYSGNQSFATVIV